MIVIMKFQNILYYPHKENRNCLGDGGSLRLKHYFKKYRKLNWNFQVNCEGGMEIFLDYTNYWMSANVNVLQSNHNIQLSKALSYILRHGAAKEGLQMTQGTN